VPAYRLTHILWLTGIAAVSIALCIFCRRKLVSHVAVRAVLACGLATVEIVRSVQDGIRFPFHMPFNLCNVASWATVLALATLWTGAVEFAYFVGFSGAVMTLVQPDMGKAWPTAFFLNHGATIVAVAVLAFGRIARIRRDAVWRSLAMLGIYAVIMGVFDRVYRTNYGYLRRKPEGVTLMSLMGPWPVYLVWVALLALGLFWLLWIPVRREAL